MGRKVTHGESGLPGKRKATPEYRAWRHMLDRCSSTHHAHERYYDRGIYVCPEWTGEGGYQAFLRDMGRRPSPQHSIDRIENDGNYEPGNIRWATAREQQRNTGQNVMLTIGGKTKCVAEWAEVSPVTDMAIRARLRAGWPHKDAVFEASQRRGPVKDNRTKVKYQSSGPRSDSKSALRIVELVRVKAGSVSEIAKRVCLSYSTTAAYLKLLAGEGVIERIERHYNDVIYQA